MPESLFDYAVGETTDTYTDLSFPHTAPVVTPVQRAAATTVCQTAGVTDQVSLAACVTDVVVTENTAFAATAAAAAPPLAAGIVDVPAATGVPVRIEQGIPGPPVLVGCADGQREGLNDLARFPHVAACLGSWTDTKSLRAPTSSSACGDDLGTCAAPADLCAPGWHICGTSGNPAELLRLSAAECEQAGGGAYMAALSYCAGSTPACTYAASQSTPYGCAAGGSCSEPVCCGNSCGGYGACIDGVWAGRTHVIVAGGGCAAVPAPIAGGVLCCDVVAAVTCGSGVSYDDGNPCTRDSCDPVAGVRHIPVPGQSCADANVCNGAEVCDATGACLAGVPLVVDDHNACTTDACDPTTGVSHTPSAGATCSDNNVCNGIESCTVAGICRSGVPLVVDDNNICTSDACDPIHGVTHTPIPTSDGNPCTVDGCDGAVGVYHTPSAAGANCADGNLCYISQACDGATHCVGQPLPSLNDNNACTVDSCAPSTGVVAHTPGPAGVTCGTGNVCAGFPTCNASGTCLPGTPAIVDDGNPCTVDTCDATTGVRHVPSAAGTACTDGNLCNSPGSCNGTGACSGITSRSVDDHNPCTVDSCDAATGVIFHTPAAAGSGVVGCSDGNICNGAEACNSVGACAPGLPPPLSDNIPCTVDSCDPITGVHHTPGLGCISDSVALAAGGAHTCELKPDRTVSCWGYHTSADTTRLTPPAGELFVQISAGESHTCGLKADGTIRCWGDDSQGQRDAPLTGTFQQVSANYNATCGLRTDGTISCWGSSAVTGSVPASNLVFSAVATGQYGLSGLKPDGSIACWGGVTAPPTTGAYTQLVVGTTYGCALRNDGVTVCWGSTPPAGVAFTQLSAGQYAACGITMTGTLTCWGNDVYGEISGVPSGTFVRLSSGEHHVCAVRNDGAVVCWGDNTSGQATPPN